MVLKVSLGRLAGERVASAIRLVRRCESAGERDRFVEASPLQAAGFQ